LRGAEDMPAGADPRRVGFAALGKDDSAEDPIRRADADPLAHRERPESHRERPESHRERL
jgi:hypothetical protein